MLQHLCEEQEAQGAQVMREVCCVPYAHTPRCQPPSHWAPGVLCSCEGSGVRSCSPVGKEAEVIVCFRYLSLSHCLGLRRGKSIPCWLQTHSLAPRAPGSFTVPQSLQVHGSSGCQEQQPDGGSQEPSPCSAVSAPQSLPAEICGVCGVLHVRSAAHKAPTQGPHISCLHCAESLAPSF